MFPALVASQGILQDAMKSPLADARAGEESIITWREVDVRCRTQAPQTTIYVMQAPGQVAIFA